MKQKHRSNKEILRWVLSGVFLLCILGIGVFGIVCLRPQPADAETETEKVEQTAPQAEVQTKKPDSIYDSEYPEISRRLMNNDTAGMKVVFLTFDDGPTVYSEEVLDILKQYGVRATFFSIGADADLATTVWTRVLAEGHTLANHSLSHNYDLYDQPEAFFADVQQQTDFQEAITGQASSGLFRFPGGSLTANETCCKGIVERGYNYVDWNVSSMDADRVTPSPDEISNSVVNGCEGYEVSVVLCHAEVKENTRIALPQIIEALRERGYIFLPMKKEYTYPRHF